MRRIKGDARSLDYGAYVGQGTWDMHTGAVRSRRSPPRQHP